MTFDSALYFVEYPLQIMALTWMAVLYSVKAVQLSRLPMPWGQAPARGSKAAEISRSYAGIHLNSYPGSSCRGPVRAARTTCGVGSNSVPIT